MIRQTIRDPLFGFNCDDSITVSLNPGLKTAPLGIKADTLLSLDGSRDSAVAHC